MVDHDLDATLTDFMATSQSIHYSKFKRFSNVADEISTKLLSSVCECEVLVGVPGWYDFEFLIKAVERKRRTQLIYRKLKLLITAKFQSHYKVT